MFERPDLPDSFRIHLFEGPFDGMSVEVHGRVVPPWWIYVVPGRGAGTLQAYHPDEHAPSGSEMYSLGAKRNDGSYTARHHGTVRSDPPAAE